MLYSGARPSSAGVRRTHGVPVAVDPGRQVGALPGPSAGPRRGRRHRDVGAPMRSPQKPTSSSRSGRACRTSPPAPGRCSTRPTCKIARAQRRRPTTRPSTRRSPLVGDADAALERVARGARRVRPPGLDQRAAKARRGLVRRGAHGAGADRRRTALRRPGDRRGRAHARRHNAMVVCAAGGLPGELHKLWRPRPRPAAITWNTASPAWATRSPAGSGSRWPARHAR